MILALHITNYSFPKNHINEGFLMQEQWIVGKKMALKKIGIGLCIAPIGFVLLIMLLSGANSAGRAVLLLIGIVLEVLVAIPALIMIILGIKRERKQKSQRDTGSGVAFDSYIEPTQIESNRSTKKQKKKDEKANKTEIIF
jgi:hypothetical protein